MNVADNLANKWPCALQNSALLDSALVVLDGSDYVYQWGQRYPDRATQLIESGAIFKRYSYADYQRDLAKLLATVTDEATLHHTLRIFRQQAMVRIIWRDLARLADLNETMQDLSALADACIKQTLSILYDWQTSTLGTPYDADGKPQQMMVIAMGKLGAYELNVSSDIDLIFAYSAEGDTQEGQRTVSHQTFFVRLGQKFIQALSNITSDGLVFRVDMRLRPFGDSGALALSVAAMEDYYQTQGREWERYAMIKARLLTGEAAAKKELGALLKAFVYRRYLDYGVFDALRDMKAMMATQIQRKDMADNIKLGIGGIREIEFIGQMFQLVYGGKHPSLQQRQILTILDALAKKDILPVQVVACLKQAYVFLRKVEHRLQAYADKQTHCLPTTDAAQMRLAQLMGFADWQGFLSVLSDYRQQVQAHFEQILALPNNETSARASTLLTANLAEKQAYLAQLGFAKPKASADELVALINCHHFRYLSRNGHARLQKLLPLLVQAAAKLSHPDTCLLRLCRLLESIMRRTAYMVLLIENEVALLQLAKLCNASAMISHQLARHPVLLDELLDPRQLYQTFSGQDQQDRLANALAAVEEGDLEQQMEVLRTFKQVATLHVATANMTGVLPLMKVADRLSELADMQLTQVMRLAWRYLVTKYGRPPCTQHDDLSQSGFAVVAYGKLGGLELGYGSDLDLVFIFDDHQQGDTDGEKSLDVLTFYIRLAQRMIHFLNTLTPNGVLYQVDTRLRPNGSSSVLATGISAFADYQRHDAWTWEHQALVRARCVAGDTILAQKISDIRCQVLARKRTRKVLLSEVAAMRAKMRKELDKSTSQLFDLKQGIGGMTDIEFMVQYAVLAWSSEHPELLKYTDNIRLLAALKLTGKLNEQDSDMLAGAYRFYRAKANHCALQEIEAVVAVEGCGDLLAASTRCLAALVLREPLITPVHLKA